VEAVAPSYQCVLKVLWSLESGQSARRGLLEFLHEQNGEFAETLTRWLSAREHGLDRSQLTNQQGPHTQALFAILEMGLDGAPILENLRTLERSFYQASMDQVEKYIASLPLISLLPTLGLVFPAFVVLLIGPLMQQLLLGLSL
jgi:hypothetical protein